MGPCNYLFSKDVKEELIQSRNYIKPQFFIPSVDGPVQIEGVPP